MVSTRRRSCKRRRVVSTASAAAEKIAANDDLLTEILKRLRPEPLFRSKLVCKNWLSIIQEDHNLSLLWKKRNLISGIFIRRYSQSYRSITKIKYYFISLEGDKKSQPNSKASIKSISFVAQLPTGVEILHSCNGVLLCSAKPSYYRLEYYFICNPTTKRYDTVPGPPGFDKSEWKSCGINLVVDLSKSTPQYKVFSFSRYTVLSTQFIRIQEFSSETLRWKLVADLIETEAYGTYFNTGVFLNGAIHWHGFPGTSVYFDVNKERITSIPVSSKMVGFWNKLIYFGESNGHLRIIEFPHFEMVSEFDVFEMESDNSKWFIKYHVDFSDIVAATLPKMVCDEIRVLSVIPAEVKPESELVLYISGKVVSYNLDNGTCRKIMDLSLRESDKTDLNAQGWKLVHQYIQNPFWAL